MSLRPRAVRARQALLYRLRPPRRSPGGVELPDDDGRDALAAAAVLDAGAEARAAGCVPGAIVVVRRYAPVRTGQVRWGERLASVDLEDVMCELRTEDGR